MKVGESRGGGVSVIELEGVRAGLCAPFTVPVLSPKGLKKRITLAFLVSEFRCTRIMDRACLKRRETFCRLGA